VLRQFLPTPLDNGGVLVVSASHSALESIYTVHQAVTCLFRWSMHLRVNGPYIPWINKPGLRGRTVLQINPTKKKAIVRQAVSEGVPAPENTL
jgi:hypothetical protein